MLFRSPKPQTPNPISVNSIIMGGKKSKVEPPPQDLQPAVELQTLDFSSIGKSRADKQLAQKMSECKQMQELVAVLERDKANLESMVKTLKTALAECADWRLVDQVDTEVAKKIIRLEDDKFQYADGEYRGQIWGGVPNGVGEVHSTSGNIYKGEYYYCRREGHGHLKYANGDVYDGKWQAGKKEGLGKYYWSNGELYEGSFSDDFIAGLGQKTYQGGKIYLGQWKQGKWNGKGIEISSNGEMITAANWKNDVFDGEVREYYLKEAFVYVNGVIVDRISKKALKEKSSKIRSTAVPEEPTAPQ